MDNDKLEIIDETENGGVILAIGRALSLNLEEYSDFDKAQENAKKYLGDDAVLYPSNRCTYKYMIYNNKGRRIHFGYKFITDYTQEKNEALRKDILDQYKHKKGNWRSNKYSVPNLEINILWQ